MCVLYVEEAAKPNGDGREEQKVYRTDSEGLCAYLYKYGSVSKPERLAMSSSLHEKLLCPRIYIC